MAGAVLHAPLGAQVRDTLPKRRDTTLVLPIPARADSLLRDSLARKAARDSAKALMVEDSIARADSVKPPIAHSDVPIDIGIARRLYWNRDSLFQTGALTLADLVDRVPGVETFHAGWVAAPAVGTYLGDTKHVRVFFDGFEYLPLDPRGQGVLDLTQINLWAAEDVTLEQTADEIRVYIRSWRVTKTFAETRTDVSTGDQATNMYRGFFGKRWRNGMDLQFAAQQFGTTPPQVLGNPSTQTGAVGRVGWSNERFSVDGFATHISRQRGAIFTEIPVGATVPLDSLLPVTSSRTDLYARVAFADPDTSHFWAQGMVIKSSYNYTGIRTLKLRTLPGTSADTAFNRLPLDTTVTFNQYLLTAGTVRGPLRVSGTARFIVSAGKTFTAPSARASWTTSLINVSAFAEAKTADSISRGDVTAQFTPLSFVSLLGSVGHATNDHLADSALSTNYARAEVGLRVKNLWLLGGMIRRDSILSAPPSIFNPFPVDSSQLLATRGQPSATGVTAAIRGQVWRILQADVSAIRWNDSAGFYRPRYQTRSEFFVRTQLLDKFPSGHLGIKAAIVHEYRSGVTFPVGNHGVETVPGYRTLSSLLEIRILTATISWQFRNFLGERYSQVPGYGMPRQTNFYGVRWTFFD